MTKELIGCCGAYCSRCKAYLNGCKGCKTGYANKERDIAKAKCPIKVCCILRRYISCADCSESESCEVLNGFYNKTGYKYGQYKKAVEFIKQKGYDEFLKIADAWNNAMGKYKEKN